MLFKRTRRFFANIWFGVFKGKKYTELEKFKSNTFYESGLERYLNDFQKRGTKHTLDFKNFFLHYSYGRGSNNFDYIYSDADYTLVLTYRENMIRKEKEVACIGFNVVNQSTILIKQIQGVQGMLSVLQHFRWEKMLLNIVMDWAKKAGFKTVRVIKAESSQWYREHRAESLFMKYDVTARRSGFKFDEKDQTYFRTLIETS